ncbi:ABC transporter ATP-binding protein [Streptomyces sp. NPDC017979]|uniref:ABC transporter ATP-binding protein n=1 Tax=Streptomyces sp. NPDC017979 TaxID=3365024 RepID=UPI00378DFD59
MTRPPAPDTADAPRDAIDVIRTSGLRKVYPGADFAAVDGIDLRVRRGEIFGLLGPNGAGKTTTVGMLTGRVVPTSGSALIGVVDVVAQPARAKQIIAAVTQENTLDRALNVRENLYFHGLLFGIPARASRERADELLDEFRLARWARSSVYALSGGMAQRLMLARAVFHRPAVLFLDEPTAGLDPQGRLALWESLAQLMADGQTILLTTHNMEEADRLCDRVAIIDHGRILALDTPAALKRGLGADTTVTVVAKGSAADLAAVLCRDVPGVVRSRLTDGGVELQVKGGERLLARVVASAEAAGFDLVDLSLAQSSLETVFISLTGKELRE